MRYERAAMPPKGLASVMGGDVIPAIDSVRTGRRFSMVIDEAVLAQIGTHAFNMAVERLGVEAAYAYRHEVEHIVKGYVLDRAWAEPIIRDAIRESVREIIAEMFDNTPADS